MFAKLFSWLSIRRRPDRSCRGCVFNPDAGAKQVEIAQKIAQVRLSIGVHPVYPDHDVFNGRCLYSPGAGRVSG